MTSESTGTLFTTLMECLNGVVSTITARGLVRSAARRCGLSDRQLAMPGKVTPDVSAALLSGIPLFGVDASALSECRRRLEAARSVEAASWSKQIHTEDDLVDARSSSRQVARSIGFQNTDQIKIITAVSELVRNTLLYAGGGELTLQATEGVRGIRIIVSDQGPGISDLAHVLNGTYKSKTGMGKGLLGCQRLMDKLHIETAPLAGTTITAVKYLT